MPCSVHHVGGWSWRGGAGGPGRPTRWSAPADEPTQNPVTGALRPRPDKSKRRFRCHTPKTISKLGSPRHFWGGPLSEPPHRAQPSTWGLTCEFLVRVPSPGKPQHGVVEASRQEAARFTDARLPVSFASLGPVWQGLPRIRYAHPSGPTRRVCLPDDEERARA